jgi:hypothetical protein
MRVMRVYLAGPMTGLPHFNWDAFNAEATRLRSLGYEVENPAEGHETQDKSWLYYMRKAITQMLRCDMVGLLPGWEKSKGASIEANLAFDIGLHVLPVELITEDICL